jgi:hypothetical protein
MRGQLGVSLLVLGSGDLIVITDKIPVALFNGKR